MQTISHVGPRIRIPADLTSIGIVDQHIRTCNGNGDGSWTAILFRYFESIIETQDVQQLRDAWGCLNSHRANVLKAGLDYSQIRHWQQAIEGLFSALEPAVDLDTGLATSMLLDVFNDTVQMHSVVNYFKILLAAYVLHNWPHCGLPTEEHALDIVADLNDQGNHRLGRSGLPALASMLGVNLDMIELGVDGPALFESFSNAAFTIEVLVQSGLHHVLYPMRNLESVDRAMSPTPQGMQQFAINLGLHDRRLEDETGLCDYHYIPGCALPDSTIRTPPTDLPMAPFMDPYPPMQSPRLIDMLPECFNPQIHPGNDGLGSEYLSAYGQSFVQTNSGSTPEAVSALPEAQDPQPLDHTPPEQAGPSSVAAQHPRNDHDNTAENPMAGPTQLRWRTSSIQHAFQEKLPGTLRNSGSGCNPRTKFVLAVDLLNPTPQAELKKHKLKTLVPAPRSFFMDVKCPGCFTITTVFSHAQTVVVCAGCSQVLCQPTGGKARLTEGCSFRRK
ncbi:40S ribosomal protein S27 [Sphaceloma murrayae]|uniref:40S ribosomal protein S27 n=1 Tax=Sphaceloma murrayae TaxID=2082308 RepID=A0A2K1QLG8_9PEZI|nr:40S ribosomal protein S27 [Sphaceloma murrayae]